MTGGQSPVAFFTHGWWAVLVGFFSHDRRAGMLATVLLWLSFNMESAQCGDTAYYVRYPALVLLTYLFNCLGTQTHKGSCALVHNL